MYQCLCCGTAIDPMMWDNYYYKIKQKTTVSTFHRPRGWWWGWAVLMSNDWVKISVWYYSLQDSISSNLMDTLSVLEIPVYKHHYTQKEIVYTDVCSVSAQKKGMSFSVHDFQPSPCITPVLWSSLIARCSSTYNGFILLFVKFISVTQRGKFLMSRILKLY